MNQLEFTKMQSLGNHFVIIDATQKEFNLNENQIQRMGNPHFGVGFDQLLVLDAPSSQDVDFNYRIFNADGGEVEQCGNGVRCLARFIQKNHFPNRTSFKLATKNRRISIFIDGEEVLAQMGLPDFNPDSIPFSSAKRLPVYDLEVEGKTYSIGAVSLGNPHAVMQVPSIDNAPVDSLGFKISTHANFPNQVNVEFMEIVDRHTIRLRVYERGVGETLACGSGACAAVVIGRIWGLLDEVVQVNLSGGNLRVRWPSENDPIELIGSGEFVFTGLFYVLQ